MARWRSTCRVTGRGTFEAQLIPKHECRFMGFDDKILALYARGICAAKQSSSRSPSCRAGGATSCAYGSSRSSG